jgi:hypothetical protein
MRRLELRADSEISENQWRRMVEWYRQHNAGPGPLDDYDWVSGPQATFKKRRWRPALRSPDQHRFLPRVERQLPLVMEAEFE